MQGADLHKWVAVRGFSGSSSALRFFLGETTCIRRAGFDINSLVGFLLLSPRGLSFLLEPSKPTK